MFITNKNISESLVRSLQNSFATQSNCEITLMCEGKTIKCHRHVLSLHSKHLGVLFKDQSSFPTAVAVVNMKFSHLKSMVEYMYFGRIKLSEDFEEQAQLIRCAEDLGLSVLVNFIKEYQKSVGRTPINGNASDGSNCEMNGDDSLPKRKRESEVPSRSNDEFFKKPKLNRETLNFSDDDEIKPKNGDKSQLKEEEEKRKAQETKEEEERKRKAEKEKKEEEEKKRKAQELREEEERKKKAAEKKREEEEQRKKALELEEEDKRRKIAAAEKAKEEEEKKRKALEEEKAKMVEEEKQCNVCHKHYSSVLDHRDVFQGQPFEKRCMMSNCSKPLKFRRSLIDHLQKEHKIDVCDGPPPAE